MFVKLLEEKRLFTSRKHTVMIGVATSVGIVISGILRIVPGLYFRTVALSRFPIIAPADRSIASRTCVGSVVSVLYTVYETQY